MQMHGREMRTLAASGCRDIQSRPDERSIRRTGELARADAISEHQSSGSLRARCPFSKLPPPGARSRRRRKRCRRGNDWSRQADPPKRDPDGRAVDPAE